MQYLLLARTDEARWPRMTKAEQEQGVAAFVEYVQALTTAGALIGSYRPQPSATAKTVRITDGKTQVLDGLQADAQEQLGGLYIIDVPDLDAALSWAERNPAAGFGVVEVRPVSMR
jgi:hypothetical protein